MGSGRGLGRGAMWRGRRSVVRFGPSVSCLVLVLMVVVAGPRPMAAERSAPARLTVRAAPLASYFNGDGFADLAVAEPQEAIGSITLAGAVSVFYGSATGIGIAGNQFWSQSTMGIADTAETDDGFGAALAAGDVNDDGFGDP